MSELKQSISTKLVSSSLPVLSISIFEISALLGDAIQTGGHAVRAARKKRIKNFLIMQDFTFFPIKVPGSPDEAGPSRSRVGVLRVFREILADIPVEYKRNDRAGGSGAELN
jgi:hypothetical protein